MSSIIKRIKKFRKRFIQGINLQNIKRFEICAGEVVKIAEAVTPHLIKLSPKLESVLGSQKFKEYRKEFVSQTIY